MARFGARRPQAIRDPLPIVLIVCDDSRTAPAYFTEIRTQLKELCTLKPVPVPKEPEAVLEAACKHKDDLSDEGIGATVWALIDLEMKPNSAGVAASLAEKAKKCGVELVLSQPCFEVWVLAHFLSTGQMFASCDAVVHELKKRWKSAFGQEFPPKKAQADYRKLLDRLQDAISNAKIHDCSKSQSWTEVWRVLVHLSSFHTF